MIVQDHFQFDKDCYKEIKTYHVFHGVFVIVLSCCWNQKEMQLKCCSLRVETVLY